MPVQYFQQMDLRHSLVLTGLLSVWGAPPDVRVVPNVAKLSSGILVHLCMLVAAAKVKQLMIEFLKEGHKPQRKRTTQCDAQVGRD